MQPLKPLDVPLRGVQLIEASAGTGKTFAITTLVLRAVLEGRRIDQILVVTFTVAATAELRGRIRARLKRAAAALANPAAAGDDTDLHELVAARHRAGDPGKDRARLQDALNTFDEAPIFTIHGFCQRVLHELAFECGAPFDVELIADPRLPLIDAVRDFWTRRLSGAPLELVERLGDEKIAFATLTTLAGTFAMHRDLDVRCAPPADAATDPIAEAVRRLLREAGAEILAALDQRKAAAGVQDFDDLLHRVAAAVQGPHGAALCEALRRRYPLALIDECQDTDPVQYRIFRQVYGGASGDEGLFLIGDPKQAIYAFRGADVFAYLRARRDAQRAWSLRTNWRSSPRLVRAVNTVFRAVDDPFVLAGIVFEDAEPAPPNADELGGALAGAAPLRFLFAERTPKRRNRLNRLSRSEGDLRWYADAIADAIVELLDGSGTIAGERIRPRDVAVLTRTNRQLMLIQTALRRAEVPSVILGDTSVFDTAEAMILERLLAALVDPGNAAALRAALVTPLVGLTGDDLVRFADDEDAWEQWVERFHRWAERWRTAGFTAAFRGVLDELDAPARVLAREGGERCLTNVLHLGELLQQAAGEGRRGPHALLEWLHRMRCDPGERERAGADAAQLRLESDVNAVTLTTVHKSKGLEYPVVVCPFTWGTYRPGAGAISPPFHARDDERLCIDVGVPPNPDSLARADEESAAEAARLLYVALTRARQLCLVPWGAFTGFEASAAARLLHGKGADGGRRDAAAIGALTDAALRADLEALAARAEGAIAVEALSVGRRLRHQPDSGEAALQLEPPPALAAVPQRWRLGSFTAMTAGAEAIGLRAQAGVDRDELAQGDAPAPAKSPAVLRGFPRGRGPGQLVHRIFEHLDFTDPDPDALRAVVERQVAASPVSREWVAPLCHAIRDVLDTPLISEAPVLRLADVPRTRRLNELEFTFPVALATEQEPAPQRPLTAAALADVFARHGDGALAAYAERLRRLPMPAWSGYLTGFIDCVLEHDGRWYVIDYKSNDLGDDPAHYTPAALADEMARHDYFLQAHLYLVALHRHLTRRLRGYRYEQHVGGALYLFVRGMTPATGPAAGVATVTPSPALIAALSATLAGGAS